MNSSAIPPILVLAGGRATRLKELSKDLPKYLMPVDPEQTFADVHLNWLKSLGFNEVLLSIGHLGEQIRNHCEDGSRWGLKISYIEDGPSLVGTGGAVRNSLRINYDELAITYGDTLLNLQLSKLLNRFRTQKAAGLMTIYKNEVPGHVCNIHWEAPYVTYDKAHPRPEWKYIDYGFMILKRTLIESFPSENPLDLAAPLSQASLQKQIIGFPVKERFWEIGSPEALAEFQAKFHS